MRWLCSTCLGLAAASSAAAQGILVFTKATDYYHESIPTAIDAITAMGANLSAPVTASNDSTVFSDANLRTISVVAFVSNSEPLAGPPILNDTEQAAFLKWLGQGGGMVGVHAATACLFSVPWFSTLLGSTFTYHPDLQQASFLVLNRSNPSTAALPSPWTFVEEVYNFNSNPRSNNVTLLLTVNESSYTDPNRQDMPAEGTPHPIAWFRDASSPGVNLSGTFAPGRTWYTSLGHTIETWQNATFLSHVQNGIAWVLEASPNSNYTNGTASASAHQAAVSPTSSTVSKSGSSALVVTLYTGLLVLTTLTTAYATL